MIFLSTFFGADTSALSPTPTYVDNINNLTAEKILLHTIWGSTDTTWGDTDPEKILGPVPPSVWDYDTIIYNCYDSTVISGNIDWTIKDIDHIIIKRCNVYEDYPSEGCIIFDKGRDDRWTIIAEKEVNDINDLELSGVDVTPGTGVYQYAIVPISNRQEGLYGTTHDPMNVKVNKLTLVEENGNAWATFITDGNLSTTNTTPGSFIQTLHNKYPTYVSNTIANYQTISVSGEWYPVDVCCGYDLILNDELRNRYIKAFIEFLTDRKPKILKGIDGRTWLCMVDDGVANNMQDYYKTRQITFNCVEVGDPNSTEDLAVSGITNVSEQFW